MLCTDTDPVRVSDETFPLSGNFWSDA